MDDKFTWFGSLGKKSKLDRFLLNLSWSLNNAWQSSGDGRLVSDHIPIILKANFSNWGEGPLREFNSWLDNKDFICWLEGEKFTEREVIQILVLIPGERRGAESRNGALPTKEHQQTH